MEKDIRYKIIDISFQPEDLRQLKRLVEAVNRCIARDDLYLEIEEQALKVHLNKIDLEKFGGIIAPGCETYLQVIKNEIEAIRSYGINGKKRIYVDYNKERKVRNRKAKEENRGKYYYARDNDFSKENRNLPGPFRDQIICGDSLKILRQLPENCIDLVFTSPPYNFGLEYHQQQDEHFWERYFEKLFSIFRECVRVLKFGGRIIVNIQPLFSDYIPTHHMISRFFLDEKLIWKGEILWEKNNYNCKYTAWGSWKSPASPYLKYTWEFLEIFCKGDLKKTGRRDDIDITDEEFKSWVVAKWSIAPERKMKEMGHPAMFPEELVRRVLKLFSYRNDIILDPFNGVGTTTAVAMALGRHYLGIDISEKYCTLARERLKTAQRDVRDIPSRQE
ncbi:MAG: site-specific DNA-methyltransferase [FCB group bacterium]|nr:site-specific DNA-methyltransferase [FCB group bacterium]